MLIEAAANASGLVVLDSRGSASLSENVEILVASGADLTVVSLQEWDTNARHLASHFARVAKDAKLTHIVVSLGGAIVRVNPSAHLAEEGSEAELLGVYFADSGQHLEQRVYVHHDAPHTRGRTASRTSRSRPATSSVRVTRARPGDSTTSTCSTCSLGESLKLKRDVWSCWVSCSKSCTASRNRSCRPASWRL